MQCSDRDSCTAEVLCATTKLHTLQLTVRHAKFHQEIINSTLGTRQMWNLTLLPECNVTAPCSTHKVSRKTNQTRTMHVCTDCTLDTVSMFPNVYTTSTSRRSRKTPCFHGRWRDSWRGRAEGGGREVLLRPRKSTRTDMGRRSWESGRSEMPNTKNIKVKLTRKTVSQPPMSYHGNFWALSLWRFGGLTGGWKVFLLGWRVFWWAGGWNCQVCGVSLPRPTLQHHRKILHFLFCILCCEVLVLFFCAAEVRFAPSVGPAKFVFAVLFLRRKEGLVKSFYSCCGVHQKGMHGTSLKMELPRLLEPHHENENWCGQWRQCVDCACSEVTVT